MLSLFRTAFSELIYYAPYLQFSYSEKIGAKELDIQLEKCCLPALETFKKLPSYNESGTPDCFYIGKVLVKNLPLEIRLSIARLACNYSIIWFRQDSIDAKLALLLELKERLDLIKMCLE